MDVIRDCLPKELITLIVSFMDTSTKFNMRTANRYWFSIVHLDEFKIHFANEKNLPEIAQHFAKHYANKQIGISLRKIVAPGYQDFPIYHLTGLTQLTSLEMDLGFRTLRWINNIDVLYKLTNIQRLPDIPTEGRLLNLTTLKIDSDLEMVHLPLYTKLRQLIIRRYSTTKDPFAAVGNPSRLTSLEFMIGRLELSESGRNTMTQLYNLKNLQTQAFSGNTKALQLTPFFKYLTSLEKYISFGCAVHDDIFTLTKLTYLSVNRHSVNSSDDMMIDIQKISALHNLRYLDYSTEKGSHYDIDFSCLSHLTNLEGFKTVRNIAAETLKNLNSKKLTRLEIMRLDSDYIPDITKFSTQLLELTVISTNAMLSPESFQSGLSLKNLTKLFLSSSRNYTLDPLENLKWLKIKFGQSPENFSLQKLTNLEYINLYHLVLPSTVYDSLQYLTRLTHLEFPLTAQAFDDNPTVLINLPLRSLIFTERIVAPGLWSVLTQLTDLEHLQIWRVDSEEIIESFSVLTNLTHLTMKKMKLTNHIRGIHLTKLTSLQELTFRAHPRKYYARLPPDYLMQKGLTRLYNLGLH